MPKNSEIINRELSWLSFNHRVLQESIDESVPLIERLRFLGIFSNNLDEFFRVRVATIKRMIDVQHGKQRVEGIKPQVIMDKIQKKVLLLQDLFESSYNRILSELEKQNVCFLKENELTHEQESFVKKYFQDKVRSVISPIMINEGSFPYLKDHSIYLAIKLTNSKKDEKVAYAIIEVPTDSLPRFVELPAVDGRHSIILLEDLIRFSLRNVFSIFHFDTFNAWTIKLTRDAELDFDNDVSQSFLEKISRSVLGRKTGKPVRVLYDSNMAPDMLELISRRLGLDEENNLIAGSRYHNFKDFMGFPEIGKKKLFYSELPPLGHPDITGKRRVMSVMRDKDFLLHVPYQDFNIFISLLQEAAIDPAVKEISITIYRVARNSKVVNALMNACRNGKKVNVVIELQARFDEEANIYWSRKLEEVGANIFFGIPNLKVHAKLLCITRLEKDSLVNYVCVSTGNFHEGNAAVYSDLLLFSSDQKIADEVKNVFEFFEHTYRNQDYKHLIVSPLFMRDKFYQYIDAEIDNARNGKKASIYLKINNLVDKDIIGRLYEANNVGVEIVLNIRGVCSLIPGLENKSETIKAISIVDRFLEHSRIMVFHNNGDPVYIISSADWMGRNFDRRIEVACPVYSKELQQEIQDIIEIQNKDTFKARIIDQFQVNNYVADKKEGGLRSQKAIYEYYQKKLGKS